MNTDAKKYLDLGPFYPKKPTGTEPARSDGAKISGDQVTGASQGGYNTPSGAQVPSMPPTGPTSGPSVLLRHSPSSWRRASLTSSR